MKFQNSLEQKKLPNKNWLYWKKAISLISEKVYLIK